jgi:hypothetical protein
MVSREGPIIGLMSILTIPPAPAATSGTYAQRDGAAPGQIIEHYGIGLCAIMTGYGLQPWTALSSFGPTVLRYNTVPHYVVLHALGLNVTG